MIYVYGVVDQPRLALGPEKGLGGAAVEVLPLERGGLEPMAALGSFHEGFEPEVRLEALEQHHRVLEVAAGAATVVPARFGTTFADLTGLEQVLAARHEQLGQLLRMLSGQVELAVRIRASVAGGEPGGATVQLLDSLFAALASKATAAVINRRGPGNLAAAFLVGADGVPSFQQSTARVMAGEPAVRAALTGPWPPYSFTDPTVLSQQMARPARSSDG